MFSLIAISTVVYIVELWLSYARVSALFAEFCGHKTCQALTCVNHKLGSSQTSTTILLFMYTHIVHIY